MLCSRCNLELAPGASHSSAESCVDALRHALDQARLCQTCGRDVPFVVHPSCVAKAAARMGVDRAVDKAADALLRKLFGGGETQQGKSEGERFEP